MLFPTIPTTPLALTKKSSWRQFLSPITHSPRAHASLASTDASDATDTANKPPSWDAWVTGRRRTDATDANAVNDDFHDDGNTDDNNGNHDEPSEVTLRVPDLEPEEDPQPEEAPVLRRSARIIARQNNSSSGLIRRSPRLALKKRICYKE